MALSGNWVNSTRVQAGALKWGTGINPVHGVSDGAYGRDIAPGTPPAATVPTQVQDSYWHEDAWEDWHSVGESSDFNTTDEHPNVGTPTERFRNNAGDWPEWGHYGEGLPGGAAIRSENIGATQRATPNQKPSETVTEGWRNKVSGDVTISRESGLSQLLVNTSDVQLRQVRAGSQRGIGSASEYGAPIPSRVVGKIVKMFSTGQRLYDMQPREQGMRVRGWWNRNAGTGHESWMEANAQTPTRPAVRSLPALPDTGPTVGGDPTDYGYSSEDMIPYAAY